MAANINSVGLVGQSAWHKMGNVIPQEHEATKDAEKFCVECGTNWDVELSPIYSVHGESMKKSTNFTGIVRKDTGNTLGVIANEGKYEILQNRQIFQFFQPWLDSGDMLFETGGALGDGEKVWALAKICRPNMEIVAGDEIKKYVLVSSGHDGKTATRVVFTPVRVVCQNTLSSALRTENLMSVNHSKKQTLSLQEIRTQMDIMNDTFDKQVVHYKKMANTPLKPEQALDLLRKIMDVKPDASQRKVNQVQDIWQRLRSPKGGMFNAGSAWHLYNGITEYTTHSSDKPSWHFKTGQALNQKAFDVIMNAI